MNDRDFTNLVLDALKNTSPFQIADHLRMSKLTIMRWAGGQNLPHAAMREGLRKALEPFTRTAMTLHSDAETTKKIIEEAQEMVRHTDVLYSPEISRRIVNNLLRLLRSEVEPAKKVPARD